MTPQEAKLRKRKLIKEAYKRGLMEGRIIPINSKWIKGIKLVPGEYLQVLYNPEFDTLILLVGTDPSPIHINLYRNGLWAQKDNRKYVGHIPLYTQ